MLKKEYICGEQMPEDYEERKKVLNYIADLLAKTSELKKDVVVMDTGFEIFGLFHTIETACEAIKNSNPDWWATVPSIEEYDPTLGELEFENSQKQCQTKNLKMLRDYLENII